MRFPFEATSRIAGYVAKKKLSRAKKFPMVLMLEPLHACNLTCTGCGRIREYSQTIKQKLTIDECLAAVDDCGAPVVSICGGEPMIYPGIGELTAKILERKKVVYLCTNGMFIRKKIADFKPNSARAYSTWPSTASRPPRKLASSSARTRRSSRRPT